MRPCGPCNCSDRQGAYTVAIFSIVQYCFHILAISLAIAGTLTSRLTETQLYGLLFTAIILVLLSCLLYLGILWNNKCLILPWIIMAVLADIGYCSAMMGAFVFTVSISTSHNDHNLIAFFIAMLNFFIVTYVLWVVIRFFMDLVSKHPTSEYHELDEENGSRSRGKKSTIVGRLFPNSNVD